MNQKLKEWNNITDEDLEKAIMKLKTRVFDKTNVGIDAALLYALEEIKNLRWQLKLEREIK